MKHENTKHETRLQSVAPMKNAKPEFMLRLEMIRVRIESRGFCGIIPRVGPSATAGPQGGIIPLGALRPFPSPTRAGQGDYGLHISARARLESDVEAGELEVTERK